MIFAIRCPATGDALHTGVLGDEASLSGGSHNNKSWCHQCCTCPPVAASGAVKGNDVCVHYHAWTGADVELVNDGDLERVHRPIAPDAAPAPTH